VGVSSFHQTPLFLGVCRENLVQLVSSGLLSGSYSQKTCRYNIGIIATIYVSPGFVKALSKPTASQTGLITAIYYLGTWTSYVFLSGPISDRLGRRYSAFTGTFVTSVGAAMQAGAKGKGAFALMIIGRIICGFGNAIISTSVPLYQRLEISCSCHGSWANNSIPQ
jgi:MFS family permease